MPNQQFVSFLKNSSIYKDRSAYQLKYTTGFGLRLRRIDCGHFDLVNVFLQINLMPLLLNNHIFFLKMPKFSFHDEIKQQQIKLNIWHTNWRNFSFASFNCAERCWTIEFWNSTNAWCCCFIPSKSIFPLPIFARYISDSAFSGSMLFNIASYAQTVIWISKWTKKKLFEKEISETESLFPRSKISQKEHFQNRIVWMELPVGLRFRTAFTRSILDWYRSINATVWHFRLSATILILRTMDSRKSESHKIQSKSSRLQKKPKKRECFHFVDRTETRAKKQTTKIVFIWQIQNFTKNWNV